MKKIYALLVVTVFVSSCVKTDPAVNLEDEWNGYHGYLKSGEQVHTLWAGKSINVGTATYGIDENANFYVTYDCSTSGWTMSETHMYAGDKRYMPLNKPGAPKTGLFPNSGSHNPGLSIKTYTVPLSSLPPCEEPGFVVSSHCVVHSPSGQTETAWAEGSFSFTDKGWGWYDVYFFNQPENEYIILYGTTYSDDTLKLYHINASTGGAEIILSEFVGNTGGTYDAAAFCNETGDLYFVNTVTDELWANNLDDNDPSYLVGSIGGEASSATFHNNTFYYVDGVDNTIKGVTIIDGSLGPETIFDVIPGSITVNDIAMAPAGDEIYILGEVNGGTKELITWDIETETFNSTAITVNSGAQIAIGSDGMLYIMASIVEGGTHSLISLIDTSSGILSPISDEVIIIDDPFSDLSGGPVM